MIMIDYANCDMTIDELSAQLNISKEELITNIAEKYDKSIIEINNWINISKGNIKATVNILDNLLKYKRNDDNGHETKTEVKPVHSVKSSINNRVIPPYDCIKLNKETFKDAKVDDVIAYFINNKWYYKIIDYLALKTGFVKTNNEDTKVIDVLEEQTIPMFLIKQSDFEYKEEIANNDKFDEEVKNLTNKIKEKTFLKETEGSVTYVKCDNDILGPFTSNIIEKCRKDKYVEIASIMNKYPDYLEVIAVLLKERKLYENCSLDELNEEIHKKENIENLISLLNEKLQLKQDKNKCEENNGIEYLNEYEKYKNIAFLREEITDLKSLLMDVNNKVNLLMTRG